MQLGQAKAHTLRVKSKAGTWICPFNWILALKSALYSVVSHIVLISVLPIMNHRQSISKAAPMITANIHLLNKSTSRLS
jgi:hypothetical protein